MNIILFILILGVLIFVHELGHFLAAKKSGIRVDEFAIGFPPKLWSWKKGETTYSLNLIPLGGYVKIHGENYEEDSLKGKDYKRSFVNKPRWIQAIVLFAGVFFNVLLAWVLLSVSFMVGVPTIDDGRLSRHIDSSFMTAVQVVPGSPVDLAGITPGTKITGVNAAGITLLQWDTETLRDVVNESGIDEFEIFYLASGDIESEELSANITAVEGIVGDGKALGVAIEPVGVLKLPVHKALIEGASATWNYTKGITEGFIQLISDAFTGDANINTLTGPVGLIGMVGDASRLGLAYLFSFTALISLNLAVLNLFPFPALDGGRLLFVLIESIIRRPINPKIAGYVNAVGFFLLIGLMIVVTVFDVLKLF